MSANLDLSYLVALYEEKASNIVEINTNEFDKICRTCLTNTDIYHFKNLNHGNIIISSLLKTYTSLEICESDLPQNICMNCIKHLLRTHFFLERCKQSDTLLKQVFSRKMELELKSTNKSSKDSTEEDEGAYFDYVNSPKTELDERTNPSKPLNETKIVKNREVRDHECEICCKKFTSSKLRQHMRIHTKEKPYECRFCSRAFSMSGNLKRHIMTHTGERPHICQDCGKGFIQATSLHTHRRTHSVLTDDTKIIPKFACEHCGRTFKRLKPYTLHLQKKHLGESKTEITEQTEEKPDVRDLRDHICDICNRAYKTKHLLKAHRLLHGEKTFLCSECGKGFVTKAAMQSHLKIHTGERPYTCTICKKSFAHVGTFEAHTLIHTGRKPFHCNICTKSFTQISHLRYHLRTHSGERPYLCSFCGKSFALKGNLTVHVRTHTGETPYLCPVCGKGFYDSSSMKKHRRGHGEVGGFKESAA